MSTSKRVLGRGLGALLKGTSDAGYENQVQHIDIIQTYLCIFLFRYQSRLCFIQIFSLLIYLK